MLASDRSVPPNQMGRRRTRSLTTINRHLIDPADLRPRHPDPPELLAHILLIQLLDRLPVQMKLVGHVLQGGGPAASSHKEGKPLRVKGIVGDPRWALLPHHATALAQDTPDFDRQIHAGISTRKIPDLARLAIVKRPMRSPARAADRFFPRRTSRRIRAFGSPKHPRT
jgi:hypothetical protein